MQRYEDQYGDPTQFHVIMKTIHHRRDRDNYIVPYRTDEDTLEFDSLADLYERMAHYKALNTVETHDFDRSRTTVEFGTVYELIAQGEPDMDLLEATSAWQAHLVRKQAKAESDAAEAASKEAEQAAKLIQDEKALLESLLAKHGR